MARWVRFSANISWASLMMMPFSYFGIEAFVSMPDGFKLTGVSKSMENNLYASQGL